ncbi:MULTISPECIES: glycoside hydrolase family 3 N-terminal domain-containing protein [unclassified Actinomyces]|uniref:glycoside hydrolase family 3 N-terminal domain-containing protein n=1 Tax=unclassified Actinomyces TaxID=2609248 RepID=UPI000D59CBEB|nr:MULTISPECIES: glycoside hydrolase family 3 N-terminal domain-containing protein [unclassified Actinomyces]RAX22390.1 beta-glucosidase [Actinomyces sp. Z3]
MTANTTSEVAQNLNTSATAPDADRSYDPRLAELARRAAAEGTVLLTNDGVLPLSPTEPVAVFGRVQIDWFAVGYGSGGDVNAVYTTNLLGSLVEQGVSVDAELASTYRQWCNAQEPPTEEWGNWPRFYPEMEVSEELVAAAASRARTAVVVIGRAAGEDRENVLEPGGYYLTDIEHTLLEQVTGHFESTVVIINSGNVMDLSWAEELGVSALLLAWPGGMEGGRAVADVLTGVTEPGGRLTDTIARAYADYPSAANFGGQEFNNYAEDVFVGYRYFETFAPEKVLFPFGHGLGYTSFDLSQARLDSVSVDADITARVRVANTGPRPGATVVQVYRGGPADAALPRPARELVAFTRTGVIAPGETQEVMVSFPRERLASFDDDGRAGHAHAWVIESGTYPVHVGTSVRQTVEAGAVVVEKTEVVEQLQEALAPSPDVPFDRMTVTRDAEGRVQAGWEAVPTATVDLRERILAHLPQAIEPTGDVGIRFSDVVAGHATMDAFVAQLDAADLAQLAYGDVEMNSPLGAPGNAGAFGGLTERLRELGVPPVITTDGPSGIRVSAYASLLPCGTALASTWDTPLLEELAALHGQEMLRKGSDVLLAPGMNIHRDPLCGRNFEYYSEDPLLTGLAAAAVVRGIQSQGVSACPKHFACNNQETNRIYNDSRVSARALREIYLRGFRICVQEAGPHNIMTSYNKVNGQWAHYNYDLVTTILRGEWGYRGNVMTDWWMRYAPDPLFPQLKDSATRVRAGVDVLMPGGETWSSTRADGHDDAVLAGYLPDDASGERLTLGELQQTALHVLRMAATTPAARSGKCPNR